jgi:hypothetical protein
MVDHQESVDSYCGHNISIIHVQKMERCCSIIRAYCEAALISACLLLDSAA